MNYQCEYCPVCFKTLEELKQHDIDSIRNGVCRVLK
jgi:hypothetical protein